MPDEFKRHLRLATRLQGGEWVIQKAHFDSQIAVEQYLAAYKHCIVPGEETMTLVDHDTHVYPVWRANKP